METSQPTGGKLLSTKFLKVLQTGNAQLAELSRAHGTQVPGFDQRSLHWFIGCV